MDSVFGIIFKVHSETLGNTAQTELLGKTMLEWVTLSLGEGVSAVTAEYDGGLEIPLQAKQYADPSKT